jgi:hypothetical protein
MGDKPFNLSVRDRADATDISPTVHTLQETFRGSSIQIDVEVLASAFNSQNGAQTMKRFLVTLTLTCVLSVSAMAGSIPTCGAPEPAPGETQTPPAPGDTQGPSIAATVIETILSLVV